MSNHRDSTASSPESHVSLPLAIIRVGELGRMTVTVDGDEFPAPSPDVAWGRAMFGDLLDAISHERTRTVRVEVHEFDGTVFTDIIHAARRGHVAEGEQASAAPRRARHRPPHRLVEVTGTGFVPGEDITVAVPISTSEGSGDGSARAIIDPAQLLARSSEIMLIGRVSGVIVTERLSS